MKYTQQTFDDLWASAGDKITPSDFKIQTGWVVEQPIFEYMNWIQNRQDTMLAYLNQQGIPEWDATVEYQNGSSFISYSGLLYKSIQTGTNKNPITQTAYWTRAFDDYGVAATVQTNLNTHITNYGTLASLSNVVTARTNLSVYSKAEIDAGYAALAGLSTQVFSVANGTTTYHAVNKSQLDTKAPVAGNSAQEFAVATATTGNSAVNKTQFDAKTSQADQTTVGISRAASQVEADSGGSVGDFMSPITTRGAKYTSKAWVVFDGSGSIKDSFNIASVVHNSTGDYTINFTAPMTDSDYAFVCSGKPSSGSGNVVVSAKTGGTLSASAIQITCTVATATPILIDPERVSLVIFS